MRTLRSTARCLALAAAVGCAGSDDDRGRAPPTGDSSPPPTTDSGPVDDTDVTGPPALEATCVATENVLRFRCSVSITPPQPVEISYAPVDGGPGESQIRVSREEATEHEVVLDLMRPLTTYGFVVRATRDPQLERSGEVLTGYLPERARLEVELEGSTSATHLLFGSPCDGATPVIVDAAGRVVWYEEVAKSKGGRLLATSYTEDDTVLVLFAEFEMDRNALVEVGLDGSERLRVERGEDYERPLHHDVFRRDGLTYALFNHSLALDPMTPVVMDGVYVFDASGSLVREWRLIDHWVPPVELGKEFPDLSHANSVWVDEAGDLYVSFRHLSTFVKIAGGKGGAPFGEILWRLAGRDDAPLGDDFDLRSMVGDDAGFEMQHNVHQLGPGRFALLDNGDDFDEESRALQLLVDEVDHTATIEAAYPLGVHCDFQGSAWHTAVGNPVATCAPTNQAFEFLAGHPGSLTFAVRVSCLADFGTFVPRFVPLTFPRP